jgi:DNA-binding transcriptional ArsR family regulator
MVKSEALDRTFTALSDPTRRDILKRLTRGPASITELARPYDISLPGVMKHIRILERARLVTTQKQGRTRECRVAPGDLEIASRWIEAYQAEWQTRLDRLDAIIERKKGVKRAP